MKPQTLFYFLLIILINTAGCKKHKHDNPVDKLPPATQTGANTLAFLLNGEPWTPKGWSGGTTNLSLYYDESFRGGILTINTYRQLTQDDKQSLGITIDSLQQTGTYYAKKTSNLKFAFTDRIKNCDIGYFDTSIFRKGQLTITKLDKINQVISGTFEIKLYDMKCNDTIKITDGRFDLKY